MHFTCPSQLICVSNGSFVKKKVNNDATATYSWKVDNPINNYCIIPYIGDYVNIHEHYYGEKGLLELDYWVLRGNEERAKKHFKDAPRTLEALEYWFGPYPFYEDGYKLVEAPYLGMEHQSAVAYGNGFQNGYAGDDLSGTGIGLKWDFIIVHESGHEWFGNSITSKDIADMWIHEGFTCYSETLFTEYWFGKESGNLYCQGLRKNIDNDEPIIGKYLVHNEGSGDMYYKGANMLHTIRALVDNDTIFRSMLREMNRQYYHQTVTTKTIEDFMSAQLELDLTLIFDQYLRSTKPPVLQIKQSKKGTKYRWYKPIKGFNMPLLVNQAKLPCTQKWAFCAGKEFKLNANQYYLMYKKNK
jgi:aminopeptidase N